MDKFADGAKVVFTVLLLVSFLVFGVCAVVASCQVLSNTQTFVTATGFTGDASEKAIELQTAAYGAVVKEVVSPLLNALVAGFLAYVAGKTVGTVSFNLTEAKKGTGANPKQLELF